MPKPTVFLGSVVRAVLDEADPKTLAAVARKIVDALQREDILSLRGSEFQVHTVAELRALERRRPESPNNLLSIQQLRGLRL